MLEENKFSYRALLHGKDAEWYFARGLDDITAAGSYEVRLFHDDMESLGITTADCDKEHYVVAHLFVSESAATGKQQALRVVGQTLLLTICATNAVKAFTRTCEITPKGASWGSWVDLGAASTTDIQDGSITPQKLSSDIRTSVENPLRPLFVAAGAEYNDTNVDKTRIAPWGETVIHKAGHYYLNGLGDIIEAEMIAIYNAGRITNNTNYYSFKDLKIRTSLNTNIIGGEAVGVDLSGTFYGCTDLEVLSISNAEKIWINNLNNTFNNCRKLKFIIPEIDLQFMSSSKFTLAFYNCVLLERIKISQLKHSLSFAKSSLITKESILHIIISSLPTSAITITLHPDAYARLADDVDVVAALEAQPFISLVSA